MKLFVTVALILLIVSVGYTQSIDFKVNMSVQMKRGAFDPATDTVYVSGTFNSYGTTDVMTDLDNDSIYTITLSPGYARTAASSRRVWLCLSHWCAT